MRIKSLIVLLGAGLLVLALTDAASVAAQMSCTVTYDCAGNSGCSSVMGGNVTQRSLSYASQSACDSAAASAQHGLPTIRCSCGGGGGSTTTTSNINSIMSTMTPQQQVGTAVGAVGTLMILQGLSELMNGKPAPPPDPAIAQRALAAQQLNNSGIYLLKQKNYDGAINEFQQALAQAPNDANILKNLQFAQQLKKNAALAGQNSSTLGTVLGGDSSTDPLTHGGIPSPNSSALSLVNLNGPRTAYFNSTANQVPGNPNANFLHDVATGSDGQTVDLSGAAKTSVDPAFFNNGAPDPQPRVQRPIGASLEEKDTVDAINKQLFETQQTQDADQRRVVDAINKQLFDAGTTQQKVQDNTNNASPESAKTQPHN
ncbi:MAG TPA: hypothetical protein VMU62_01120 [Acidobacteriaceae bacterium]|nr:hypothetical protein [Acidobacteriaceae bacterium]